MAEDQPGMDRVTALQSLADRVSAGDPITEADARTLLDSHDLIAIGTIADAARRRLHGTRATFVRVFEVHTDALPSAVPPSLTAGEVRIIGAPSSLEKALEVVTAARRLAGVVPLTGFSLVDLMKLGAPIDDIAARLREAGLDALAEVPIDAAEDPAALVAVREAGLMAWRLTVSTYDHVSPVAVARRARDLQHVAGDLRAFAPLPRTIPAANPTTGYDDVKLVAMARLMVSDIPSIQVDWPLYGPKLAQVALIMGADDIDRIAAFDPGALGTRRSALAEIIGNIRAAMLEPVERNGRFEVTTRLDHPGNPDMSRSAGSSGTQSRDESRRKIG